MSHRESTRLALEQNFPVFAPSITTLRSEGLGDFEIQDFIAKRITAMRESGQSPKEIDDFLNLASFQPERPGIGERFFQSAKQEATLGLLPSDLPAPEGLGEGFADIGGSLLGFIVPLLLTRGIASPLVRGATRGVTAGATAGLTAREATGLSRGLIKGGIEGGIFTALTETGSAIGRQTLPAPDEVIKNLIINTALFGGVEALAGIRAGRLPLTQEAAEIKALPFRREPLALTEGEFGPPRGPLALPEPDPRFILPERAGPGRPALGESRLLEQVPTDLADPRIPAGPAAIQRPIELPGEIVGRPRLAQPSAFEIQLEKGRALLRPRTRGPRVLDAAEFGEPSPRLERITEAKAVVGREPDVPGRITSAEEIASPEFVARKVKKGAQPRIEVPESPESIIREIRDLEIPGEVVSEQIAAINTKLPTRGLPEVAKSLRRSKGRVNKTQATKKGTKPAKKTKARSEAGAKQLAQDLKLEEARVTEAATIVERPEALAELRVIAKEHGLQVRFRKGQGFVEGKVGARKVKVPFNDPDIAIKDIFRGRDHFAETGALTERELANQILDYQRSIQEPANPITPDPGGNRPVICLSPCRPRPGQKDLLSSEELSQKRDMLNALDERARLVADQPDVVTTFRERIANPLKTIRANSSGKPFGTKFFSPSFYLERFKSGLEIIRRIDTQTRENLKWVNETHTRVYGSRKNVVSRRKGGIEELGIRKGSINSDRVGVVLENPGAAALFEPKIGKAATILRNEFERLLREVRVLAPGEKIGRVKDYLPRLFDRDTIRAELQAEIAEFTALGDPQSLRQAAHATESLARMNKVGGLTYEQLPLKLKNRFFETRHGRTGYSFDALKAYDVYVSSTARKIFMEPILRDAQALVEALPQNLQGLAVEHIRDATGLGRNVTDGAARHLAKIRELEFVRTIGFNPATAVKNMTQQLFTIAELGADGPRAVTKAWRMYTTSPEARFLFDTSGHGLDVPNIFLQNRTNLHPRWQRFVEFSGWLFNKVETTNRAVTYLAGLDTWLARNVRKTGLTMETVLRDPTKLPAEAITFADDLVRKTQFRYGKVDLPLLLRNEVVGTAFQFSSFAVKASELMWKWAVREGASGRLKLVSFVAAAGMMQTLGGLAGFPTLGDGTASPLNVPEMFEFFASVTEGDIKRAKAAAFNTFDFDPLTIGFGPFVSGVTEGAKVLRQAREGLPVMDAATRFAWNELAPVTARRVKDALVEFQAGGSPTDFVTATLGVPTSTTILRQQAIRLVEQGKTEDLKEFIQAIRDLHGGLPKDFIKGSFKRKAKRELAKERRRKRAERKGETVLDRQIRKRFTRTERLLRNRFIRPIGGL